MTALESASAVAASKPYDTASGFKLTDGPIVRTLLAFALPTLVLTALQTFNGSVNAFWVGNLIGEQALAATTNANLIMHLSNATVLGFGTAATIIVSQAIGRRDVGAARSAMGAAIGIFLLLGVVTASTGWLLAPWLLDVLKTPPDVLPFALPYLRMICVSLPPSFLIVLIGMGLRATGDSVTPLLFMVFSVLIDIALNPVFILGLGPSPAFGIAGAAGATLAANAISLVALIGYIYRRQLTLRLRGAEWRYLVPERALLATIVAKGVPMALQMFTMSASAIAMVSLVNQAGSETTAAFAACSQLWTYTQMPAIAVSAAVSVMVAQNIGAGRWDRVDGIARVGVLVTLLLTGALIAAFVVFDRALFSLFLDSRGHAFAIARHVNSLVTWSLLFLATSTILQSVTRANGAALGPLIIFLFAMFPIRLGIAFPLFPRFGSEAIWWSMVSSYAAALALTAVYYGHGSWRRKRLLVPGAPEIAQASQAAASTLAS